MMTLKHSISKTSEDLQNMLFETNFLLSNPPEKEYRRKQSIFFFFFLVCYVNTWISSAQTNLLSRAHWWPDHLVISGLLQSYSSISLGRITLESLQPEMYYFAGTISGVLIITTSYHKAGIDNKGKGPLWSLI